jgi:DNA-binding GntR family transcriptional regulator
MQFKIRHVILFCMGNTVHHQHNPRVTFFQACFSDQHVSEQLNISSGSPILFAERIMYGKKKGRSKWFKRHIAVKVAVG